ncbi:LysR family transcriptional regulator [Thioclava sp. BHET1]|nr:LysR family transcriptional regulator [Thioclava sp. BHET1]
MPLQNLNLLRTFLVLMEERSVTGAARRMNMTQSAVSNALDRLREQLGDRLLERQGNQMIPGLRARELEPEIRASLASIDRALEPETAPADLTGTFRLGIDEYSLALIGPALMQVLHRQSPGLGVALISAWAPRDHEQLTGDMLDLIVGPIGAPLAGIELEPLFEESFVGVVDRGHPLAEERPVVTERWLAFPHLISSQNGIVPANVDQALEHVGLGREVGIAIPIMALAPRFLLGTDLVAHIGRRMAQVLAARQGLAAFDLPIDVPGFRIGMHWHPRNRASATHRWIRQALQTAYRSIPSGPAETDRMERKSDVP